MNSPPQDPFADPRLRARLIALLVTMGWPLYLAEEIAHDAYIVAMPTYDPSRGISPYTWLKICARSLARDRRKAHAYSQEHLPVDDIPLPVPADQLARITAKAQLARVFDIAGDSKNIALIEARAHCESWAEVGDMVGRSTEGARAAFGRLKKRLLAVMPTGEAS